MFARTERLLLRPAWGEDAPALARAIGDEAVVRNLARAPWPYVLADAEAFVGAGCDPQRPNFLIFRRTDGAPQLVGGIGIGDHPDGGTEFGYWIARPFWGLGFATEAGRAVVEVARTALGLERVKAGHFIDNPASGKVLRKLGFQPTGRISQRYSAGRGGEVASVDFELDLTAVRGLDQDELEAACRKLAA